MNDIKKIPGWLVVPLFVGLGWLLYGNTLEVPFYLDDNQNIVENLALRLTRLSPHGLWQAAFHSSLPNRPLANVSFALNYLLNHYHPAGYHLVNIAIHALTGIFLFCLFRDLLKTPPLASRTSKPDLLALTAALLWFVNPVQTQAVTYIVQRMTSMAAMWYVLALWLFLRGRNTQTPHPRWPWLAGSGLAGLCALGSKEIAATLPVMAFVLEWYFIQDLSRSWLKKRLPFLATLAAGCALLVWLFLGAHPLAVIENGYAPRDFTLGDRLLTEPRVVCHYLGLLLYPAPWRLNLDYDFTLSRSLFSPLTTLPAMAFVILLPVVAVVIAKRFRLLSFAILWYFGNLVIESSVIGLEIIFEHRAYLPSMLPFLALVVATDRLLRPKWVASLLFFAVLLLGSYWTHARNQVWRDPVALWADCARKAPAKPRPHNNLSVALREQGKLDQALAEGETALRLKPDFVNAHVNLGNIYQDMHLPRQALTHYLAALSLKPDYAEVYTSVGNTYLSMGDPEQAERAYRQALAMAPTSVRARVNLATILALRGESSAAITEFERARALQPNDPDILFNLGVAYANANRYQEALRAFEAAVLNNPADREAQAATARLRRSLGLPP